MLLKAWRLFAPMLDLCAVKGLHREQVFGINL